MKKFVITIARQYGSGGKEMGKLLSKELDVSYYDRELLRLAADESGINEELFARADEKVRKTLLFKAARGAYKGEIIPPDREDFTSNRNLFNFQAKVIRQLAESESCIIIGRCADYILRDMSNVLRIFVHAPLEACVNKSMEDHPDMSREELMRYITRVDKNRADYYQYFTGRSWNNAENYDLCLNSHMLGWDTCLELVKACLKVKLAEK